MSEYKVTINVPEAIKATVVPPSPIKATLQVGQGPAGAQGAPGSSGATSYIYSAAQPISGHRAVMLNGAGEVTYPSAANLSDASLVLGVSTNAASTGQAVTVVRTGEVTEPSWNWVGRNPVYLGIDGVLTQNVPVLPASLFSLVIGIPISPTKLFVNVQQPLVLT